MKNFESELPEKHIPAAKKLVYLDRQMFATIVSMIPAGKLTTQEAIYEMWAKRKGADRCELQNYSILPIDKRVLWKPTDVQRVDFIDDLNSYGNDDWESLIPYWRLIFPKGDAGGLWPLLHKGNAKGVFGARGPCDCPAKPESAVVPGAELQRGPI